MATDNKELRSLVLGVDVGGTFTDLVQLDQNTSVIIGRAIKILSPTENFLQNCDSYIGNVQRK